MYAPFSMRICCRRCSRPRSRPAACHLPMSLGPTVPGCSRAAAPVQTESQSPTAALKRERLGLATVLRGSRPQRGEVLRSPALVERRHSPPLFLVNLHLTVTFAGRQSSVSASEDRDLARVAHDGRNLFQRRVSETADRPPVKPDRPKDGESCGRVGESRGGSR